MNQAQLTRRVQQHKSWVKSKGKKGARANLRRTNLRHLSLQRADLRDADFRHADLLHTRLQHADLRRADLRHANLRGAVLRGAQFDINIRHCYSFCDAKFTPDALPWLILHPQWLEWQHSVQIEEVETA